MWLDCKVLEVLGPFLLRASLVHQILKYHVAHSHNLRTNIFTCLRHSITAWTDVGLLCITDSDCQLSFRALSHFCCHFCHRTHCRTRFCQKPGTDIPYPECSDFCAAAPRQLVEGLALIVLFSIHANSYLASAHSAIFESGKIRY